MPFLHTKSTTGPETRWKACNAMAAGLAARVGDGMKLVASGITARQAPARRSKNYLLISPPKQRRMTAKACLVIDPHHRSTDGTPSLFASNPGGPRQFRDG